MSSQRISKIRYVIVFASFIAVFAGIFGRLIYVQFFHPRDLGYRAEKQSKLILEIPPSRGKILDRNQIELAFDLPLDSLGVNARRVKDKRRLAKKLKKILDLEFPYLLDRLSREVGQFVVRWFVADLLGCRQPK